MSSNCETQANAQDDQVEQKRLQSFAFVESVARMSVNHNRQLVHITKNDNDMKI